MAPGHNGPYRDPETPVRNTSHWSISFLKAHELSGNPGFLEAGRRAVGYLSGPAARPMGATFWHRNNPDKDFCNGLIGQAWTIEALAVGAAALEMPELVSLAEEVFLLHPFDESLALWRRVGVDGSRLPLDLTFNHQLWFAAAGALLAPHASDEVERRVLRFMDRLEEHLDLYPSGLIRHPLALQVSWRGRLKTLARGVRGPARQRGKLAHKAVGYHAFNLYAFAMLADPYPEHPFWQTSSFMQALHYLKEEEYVERLDTNTFGYSYNAAGFEVAMAMGAFGGGPGGDPALESREWVSRQLRRCYDLEARRMSNGTDDPLTHAARLYEATRLPDLELDL